MGNNEFCGEIVIGKKLWEQSLLTVQHSGVL